MFYQYKGYLTIIPRAHVGCEMIDSKNNQEMLADHADFALQEQAEDNLIPGGVLGLMFAGYVPLASQSPYPILVYFLANYRPHLSHFLENVIFAIPT